MWRPVWHKHSTTSHISKYSCSFGTVSDDGTKFELLGTKFGAWSLQLLQAELNVYFDAKSAWVLPNFNKT